MMVRYNDKGTFKYYFFGTVIKNKYTAWISKNLILPFPLLLLCY